MKKILVGIALASFALLATGCDEPTNVESVETVHPDVATAEARQQKMDSALERRQEWLENRPTPTPEAMFTYAEPPTIENEGYGMQSIVGILNYNGDRQLSYVDISCQVLHDGVQIADSLDNATGLQPRSKWRFRAMLFEEVARYDRIVCQAEGW